MSYSAPGYVRPTLATISSHDFDLSAFFGQASTASTAYPAASLAIYVPFSLAVAATVFETFVETGTLTTSNATEIGVYDTAFTRLFSTATTVAIASDTVNSSGMTDFTLAPGNYYMAFSCDGTRAYMATTLALGLYQSMGVMEQTGLTGATLPNPGVPVVYTRAFLPLFGLNLRADVL